MGLFESYYTGEMETWTSLEKAVGGVGIQEPRETLFDELLFFLSFLHLPACCLSLQQGLSPKSESRRLGLILSKCEAVAERSRAPGLGHIGTLPT